MEYECVFGNNGCAVCVDASRQFCYAFKETENQPAELYQGRIKRKRTKTTDKTSKENAVFLKIQASHSLSYLTLALGVFLAGTLVVFGSMYGPLLDDYANIVKENQISKYQYVMINEAETKVSDAEKFCMTSLQTTDKKFIADDVTIYGVENQSRYIKENIPAGEVLVSSAMADKFL